MRNLAGDKDCDVWIVNELDLAGIPRVRLQEQLKREVPASVIGQLGPFRFERAWYYWIVSGPVPLHVAEEMYEHPVGRSDVRVAGHCGCPPPEMPWLAFYDYDGKELTHDPDSKQAREWSTLMASDSKMGEIIRAAECPRFVPDAMSVAARVVVESYHIDSQDGLNLFAETMRRHGLAGEAAA